ncbi:MAG: M23 family metallopeptidase [Elusimicrobia bacterium]|nr:M23 family metallopeptidase [Elusimicrobiota bacterium]
MISIQNSVGRWVLAALLLAPAAWARQGAAVPAGTAMPQLRSSLIPPAASGERYRRVVARIEGEEARSVSVAKDGLVGRKVFRGSAHGAPGHDGRFSASRLELAAESWSEGEGGVWSVERWVFSLSPDGELHGTRRQSFRQIPAGKALDYSDRAAALEETEEAERALEEALEAMDPGSPAPQRAGRRLLDSGLRVEAALEGLGAGRLPAAFGHAADGSRERPAAIAALELAAARRPQPTQRPAARPAPEAAGRDDGRFYPPFAGGRMARVTSRFGDARPGGRRHAGLDFGVPVGTRIHASRPGKVIQAHQFNPRTDSGHGPGGYVTVQHADGSRTRYLHLATTLVRVGQQVDHSTVLGTSGGKNNGHSTGPHLHFEIIKGGRPVDPLAALSRGTPPPAPRGRFERPDPRRQDDEEDEPARRWDRRRPAESPRWQPPQRRQDEDDEEDWYERRQRGRKFQDEDDWDDD